MYPLMLGSLIVKLAHLRAVIAIQVSRSSMRFVCRLVRECAVITIRVASALSLGNCRKGANFGSFVSIHAIHCRFLGEGVQRLHIGMVLGDNDGGSAQISSQVCHFFECRWDSISERELCCFTLIAVVECIHFCKTCTGCVFLLDPKCMLCRLRETSSNLHTFTLHSAKKPSES